MIKVMEQAAVEGATDPIKAKTFLEFLLIANRAGREATYEQRERIRQLGRQHLPPQDYVDRLNVIMGWTER